MNAVERSREVLKRAEAMRAEWARQDALRLEAARAAWNLQDALGIPPEHRPMRRLFLEEEAVESPVKEKKKDGWFRHHYTNDKNLLIRSRKCYTDPVPYPLPAVPHPATLEDAPTQEIYSEPKISMMPFDASECHYSILHSPTYKKTQRKAEAHKLERLRDSRTVSKRSETYSSLWWTWKNRSDDGSVDKYRKRQLQERKLPETKSESPGPFPSPVSLQERFDIPNVVNRKRRRPYSGYELWKEAGDDPQAKRRVSNVLHQRCHDKTKHLPDPFVTPLVERPVAGWERIEEWLEDVRREGDAEMSDDGNEDSDDSWHTTCSSFGDADHPDAMID